MSAKLNEELNRKIMAEMQMDDISKEELAEKLSLSYTTICSKLRGEVDWKLSELLEMACLFNVSLDFFN